jgi:hypothetical protein
MTALPETSGSRDPRSRGDAAAAPDDRAGARSPDWLDLLRARVDTKGSIAAVAAELGYSRSAISLALDGKYPAKVTKLKAAVVAAFTICDCPYLARTLAAAECRQYRTRPLPQSQPDQLKHWCSCQQCPVGRALAQAEAMRREAC